MPQYNELHILSRQAKKYTFGMEIFVLCIDMMICSKTDYTSLYGVLSVVFHFAEL